jgi:hypothetical protein
MTEKKPKRHAPKDLWIKAPAECTEGLEEIAKKHKIPVAALRRAVARDLTDMLEGAEVDINPRAVAARFVQARAERIEAELRELEGSQVRRMHGGHTVTDLERVIDEHRDEPVPVDDEQQEVTG